MDKTKKIGLLVSGIMDQFTESLCRGAIEASKVEGSNLIVFPGKYLDRDLSGQTEIMYEYQYNTIFEYAKSSELDGIIVSAGNIGCFTGDDRVREMLEGFGDIPCILVASKWDGYISVNFDNVSGVREGLEYLIKDMNIRRLAMVAGPEGNTDARERKETFVEVLQENDIQVTDQMIVYGDLNRDTPDQCELLLDNNPDVEAVFCVNDDMALGLYDVMRKRGLVPGKDIKVFGYDNTVAGSKAQPSLSTVGSDAIYLGKKAVSLMNRMLDGERVESVILPARFIRRNSFGRLLNSQDVIKDIAGIDSYFDVIFYRYLNSEKEDGSRLRMMFRSIAEGLLCFIDNPMEDGNDEKTLMRNVDTILDYHALDYVDMDNLVGHIERLYDVVCQKHSDIEKQFRFRMIVDNILRRVIYHMDYKVGNVRFERQNEINYMKMFVRDSLNFRKGNDTSYVALLRCVDWLDIQNAYLYIFEEPISHLYKEAFKIPENVNMKGFLKDGKIFTVPVNKQRVKIDNVVHNKVYGNGRRDYVLLPLFYNEIQYGLLLCDLSDKLYTNGEFLANQLGAAVHMVNLLHENEEIQQKLEEVVRSLRENNIALDHLSKQDSLTGIHNRRGYMDAAASLIEENRIMRRNTLVAYVDMNNLKIINDRYGHDEGDYSLKVISDILSEMIGENGVIGRIGGDEYSFSLTMEKDMDISSIERRIHAMFAAHNRRSEKTFNVTVSVGLYMLGYESDVELEDALSYADEKLYVAKQHKVRNVEK